MTSDRASPIPRAALAAGLAALLGGCASAPLPPPPAPPAPAAATAAPAAGGLRYRCDHDIEFTVQYGPDTATIDAGARGREVLLRDAGGVTPQQTVYSNERVRAEFGLGSGGDEAVLRYADPALVARCSRQ